MRWLVALLLLISSASAAPVTITLDDQEKATLMQMCQLARWAARAQMDLVCEHFQKKLSDAEKPEPKVSEKK